MDTVNVAKHPLTEYRKHLEAQGLAENTIQIYIAALRRLFNNTNEEDLADKQFMAYYRGNLSPVYRGTLGVAWRHYKDFAEKNGVTGLPDFDSVPLVKNVHPLYPDLADITAAYPLTKAARMTWSEVMREPEELRVAFRRVFDFGTKDGIWDEDRVALPYPEWILEHILFSIDRMTKRPIQKSFLNIIELATRRGISATDLKILYAIFLEKQGDFLHRTTMPGLAKHLEELMGSHDWEWAREPFLRKLRKKTPLACESQPELGRVVFW
jgi:hypothetical protein